MDKDKTKPVLESFVRLAESPEQFIAEHNKKADALLTVSALLICFPLYKMLMGDDINALIIIVLMLGSFGLGYALVFRLSTKPLETLNKFIDVEAIKKELGRDDT